MVIISNHKSSHLLNSYFQPSTVLVALCIICLNFSLPQSHKKCIIISFYSGGLERFSSWSDYVANEWHSENLNLGEPYSITSTIYWIFTVMFSNWKKLGTSETMVLRDTERLSKKKIKGIWDQGLLPKGKRTVWGKNEMASCWKTRINHLKFFVLLMCPVYITKIRAYLIMREINKEGDEKNLQAVYCTGI